MSNILLSSGARSALTALSSMQGQMDVLQKRLATGKRVNSPIDNPSAYFLAAGLTNRASTLMSLGDDIAAAKSTLSAASNGIDAMQSLLSSAKSIANSALQSSDPTVRQNFAAQFDALRAQIDTAAQDASYNGVNLLTGSSLNVVFNETGSSSMTISGTSMSSTSLGVSAAVNNWQLDGDINAAISEIDTAVNSLRSYATSYSATSGVLGTREAFNQSMINTLNSGADALVGNDSNEDGVMLLALQTRQQLATVALSLAQSSQSAALRLFATN